VDYLKQRCSLGEPLHQLFQSGDLLEITKGPFTGLLGSFEKLQTLSNGEARALVLIEILGAVQRISLNLPHLKKLGPKALLYCNY
jgi:transcriptional antiterminator RfaH